MPPDEHSGMDLILTCGLGRGFPRLEFEDHLEFELTRKATTFESQGYAFFRLNWLRVLDTAERLQVD
jgi:hypothetical protein